MSSILPSFSPSPLSQNCEDLWRKLRQWKLKEMSSILPSFSPLPPFPELQGFMEEVETIKGERDVIESELKGLNDPSACSNIRETFLKVRIDEGPTGPTIWSFMPKMNNMWRCGCTYALCRLQNVLLSWSLHTQALGEDGAISGADASLSETESDRMFQPLREQVNDSLKRQEDLLSNIQRANTQFSEQVGSWRECFQRVQVCIHEIRRGPSGLCPLKIYRFLRSDGYDLL